MKESTMLILAIGALYLYSRTALQHFTPSFVCVANDGNRFQWPTANCPYADIVANDVPYVGSPGEYIPVIF